MSEYRFITEEESKGMRQLSPHFFIDENDNIYKVVDCSCGYDNCIVEWANAIWVEAPDSEEI